MTKTLSAGAARRIINPKLGHGKAGIRLFGDPIQAVESDLTATVLVLDNQETKLVIIAADLIGMRTSSARKIRQAVANTLDIPISHVLFNFSHNHSTPAAADFVPDTAENMALKERYMSDLENRIVEAAQEANSKLQPARIGTGWGESFVGVYRREERNGQDVLGEVPDHEIDSSVGVIRVDDLNGNAIATLFRYSCHPVVVGPRSLVASTDFMGPARDVVEKSLGGLALFLQGAGGNINPRVGIGWEIDCRDTKNRVGLSLGAEVLKVASSIRTNRKQTQRIPLGNIPNILFTPWVDVEGETTADLRATDETVQLEFVEMPPLAQAQELDDYWSKTLAERQANSAPEWQVRVAVMMERWTKNLLRAINAGNATFPLYIQVLGINDIVLTTMTVETFYETGLTIRARSPYNDTFVLGYTNGTDAYLPRAEDYPEGGWKLDGQYAVPDLLFQYAGLPMALHPNSEQRAIDESLKLINQLSN